MEEVHTNQLTPEQHTEILDLSRNIYNYAVDISGEGEEVTIGQLSLVALALLHAGKSLEKYILEKA